MFSRHFMLLHVNDFKIATIWPRISYSLLEERYTCPQMLFTTRFIWHEKGDFIYFKILGHLYWFQPSQQEITFWCPVSSRICRNGIFSSCAYPNWTLRDFILCVLHKTPFRITPPPLFSKVELSSYNVWACLRPDFMACGLFHYSLISVGKNSGSHHQDQELGLCLVICKTFALFDHVSTVFLASLTPLL